MATRENGNARNPQDPLEQPWRQFAIVVLLVVLAVALGAQVARQSQTVRSLHAQLQQDRLAQDALLAERSRLLLERATLASYNNVDRLAETRLGMRFPETLTRIVVKSRNPVGGGR